MDGVTVIRPTTWTVSAEALGMDGALTATPSRHNERSIEVSLGDEIGGCQYRFLQSERLRAWCEAVLDMLDDLEA